jgi:hypothetical protein
MPLVISGGFIISTGIDAEYTRPGVEALLEKFGELAQDIDECYKFNWRQVPLPFVRPIMSAFLSNSITKQVE